MIIQTSSIDFNSRALIRVFFMFAFEIEAITFTSGVNIVNFVL